MSLCGVRDEMDRIRRSVALLGEGPSTSLIVFVLLSSRTFDMQDIRRDSFNIDSIYVLDLFILPVLVSMVVCSPNMMVVVCVYDSGISVLGFRLL